MEENLKFIIPPAFVVCFTILWFLITSLLKKFAKLGPLEIREWDLGTQIFQHSFSAATINWVNFKGVLTITGYNNGLLIKNMGIFGGGYHWIPRHELTVTFENGLLGKTAQFEYRGVNFKIRGGAGKSVVEEYGS